MKMCIMQLVKLNCVPILVFELKFLMKKRDYSDKNLLYVLLMKKEQNAFPNL
jgi:hypothetical protein